MSFHRNLWRNLLMLSLPLIVLLGGVAFSQPCTPSAGQPICVSENHAPLDQLAINDIDFENFGSTHWFFTLSIRSFIEPLSVRMHVSVDISLPTESFPNAVSFTTLPFNTPQSISNLDIGKNGSIKIEPGSFQYSNEAKNKIKDIALSTGKLPAGTYTFNVRVEDVTSSVAFDEEQIILSLQNFSRIELLAPANASPTPTAFPLFQWQYDGNRIELAVYEKFASHSSNEEALTGTPHLVVRTGDPGLSEGIRTYQYPTAGVRALEEGKTYVWVIRALAQGSGGSDAGLNSEVWSFTVSSTGGSSTNDFAEQILTNEQLSEQLTDIPGLNSDQLRAFLGDHQMTGVFYLNGQQISITELKQLLDELNANPDRIIEIKVIE